MDGLGRIRSTIRRLPLYLFWLRREVPKALGMEIYARRQDALNRRTFFQNRDAIQVTGQDPALAAYFLRPIPKTIWMYWGQGADNAPYVVKRCIESWQHHNPGWQIRVLDETTVSQFADLSDLPSFLPQRFVANLLRLRLLKAHGGVWADATVWCHRPLDDWLPLMATSGYFCLDRPGPDRWFASWFLASEPGHVLISAWEEAYGGYLRRLTAKPDKYFMFFYTFQWRLKNDAAAMAAWNQRSGLAAPLTFLVMAAIKGVVPMVRAQEVIAAGLPVSKLSWKEKIDPAEIDRVLDQLSRSHLSETSDILDSQ